MPDISVKVDGVTLAAIPYTLDVQATIGNRAALNVGARSMDGSYRPAGGKNLELFEGATKLWAGSIDEVLENSISEGVPTGRRYALRGVSWEQYLDRRFCYTGGRHLRYSRNFEYTAGPGTDKLTTTVAHGRSNGDRVRVKCHANGVLPAGLDATIEYFVINSTAMELQLSLTSGGAAVTFSDAGYLDQILITYRAGEIVQALLIAATSEPIGDSNVDLGAVMDTTIFRSDVSVWAAIGHCAVASMFSAWIDEERELFFKPRAYVAAPFAIDDTSGNYRNFSVRRTREDKCNAALMQIDIEQVGYEDETFAGDGSTVYWDLAFPVEQIIRVQVNDENKEYAIWLAEADRAFYYEYGAERIRHDPDETVLTAADTLRVVYRKFGSDTIYVEDSADIAATATNEGNSGIYALPFDRPGVGQVQAGVEGTAIIAARKETASEIQYETDQQIEPLCHTLRPGQLQTIENTYHAVASATFLIREVAIQDVGGQWLKVVVKAISTARLGGSIEYWKAIAGGSTGGGGSFGGSFGGSTGTGGGMTNREYALVADFETPSPYTPTEGDLLSVFWTQGAGEWNVTFAAEFASIVALSMPPEDGVTVGWLFKGRSDAKWWPVGQAWVSA